MKPIGEKVGFKFWKPLIFDKEIIGQGYHYRARYEMILFFEKGKRKLNDLSIPDILSEKRVLNGYPTEKPVKLLETLIKQSSNEGNIVLDPFMGSGSTAEACLNTNRDFIGCDISEKSYETVVNRIKGIK
jgi:site-specific DNA-methyltransferase (adenine-specific)